VQQSSVKNPQALAQLLIISYAEQPIYAYMFIDDFPIKTSIYKGFSMAMLNNQMVFILGIVSEDTQLR